MVIKKHIKILGLQNATSIEMVTAATAKMGVSEAAAAVATTGLSEAQKIQILRLKGLTAEEAKQRQQEQQQDLLVQHLHLKPLSMVYSQLLKHTHLLR